MRDLFLFVYLVIYLVVTFIWRSWVVWRQTGTNPVVFTTDDSAHTYIGRSMMGCIGLIVIAVIINALPGSIKDYLGPMGWLSSPISFAIGWLFLVVALIWIAFAQRQMGQSWRIGIPKTQPRANLPPLITHGVFSRSRNPIFLGMVVSLIGFFLVLPNALSLAGMLLGIVLMQIQVRLEEDYLARVYGKVYHDYCKQARRWL